MLYFVWYRKGHPRAKRLNTYESLWKGLRQLYYDQTQRAIDDSVGKPVTDVSYKLEYRFL